jgi:hypothetical protein
VQQEPQTRFHSHRVTHRVPLALQSSFQLLVQPAAPSLTRDRLAITLILDIPRQHTRRTDVWVVPGTVIICVRFREQAPLPARVCNLIRRISRGTASTDDITYSFTTFP